MLVTSDNYFKILMEYKDTFPEVKSYAHNFMRDGLIDESLLVFLYKNKSLNNKTIDFYKFLYKKMHKVIKELLRDGSRTVCECIKTITCIITQATITLEKQFNNDLEEANEFIECVGLVQLSNSLYSYFSTGDVSELEKEILRVRNDVQFIIDNFQ